MAENTIISTGTTYRLFGEAVKTHAKLPVQTYKVAFHPMMGYSLEKAEPLTTLGEKMFGRHEERLERIVGAYNRSARSLGVMLTGDKGMGKSLMVRLIAERMGESEQLPVVIVDENYPGLADFIDSLETCIVVFDEFEKVFPKGDVDEGQRSAQDQFLGLFDGMSTTKRLYLVTANEMRNLSDFLVNRPGRFHYHIRFDYPSPEQVLEYLLHNAPTVERRELEKVVVFSRKVELNYDHLRAIAFELEGGGHFEDLIEDLNIKRMVHHTRYSVEVTLANGKKVTTVEALDLFGASRQSLSYSVPGKEDVAYYFPAEAARWDRTEQAYSVDMTQAERAYGQKKGTAATKLVLRRSGADSNAGYKYNPEMLSDDGGFGDEGPQLAEWEADLMSPSAG